MSVRARRGLAVAIAALAIAAPSASAADTTAPSAPTDTSGFFDNCLGNYLVQWRASSDNVDAAGDLRYRLYDGQGRLLAGYTGATEFTHDPATGGWILFGSQRPHTIRAVDRAGNVSAPAAISLS